MTTPLANLIEAHAEIRALYTVITKRDIQPQAFCESLTAIIGLLNQRTPSDLMVCDELCELLKPALTRITPLMQADPKIAVALLDLLNILYQYSPKKTAELLNCLVGKHPFYQEIQALHLNVYHPSTTAYRLPDSFFSSYTRLFTQLCDLASPEILWLSPICFPPILGEYKILHLATCQNKANEDDRYALWENIMKLSKRQILFSQQMKELVHTLVHWQTQLKKGPNAVRMAFQLIDSGFLSLNELRKLKTWKNEVTNFITQDLDPEQKKRVLKYIIEDKDSLWHHYLTIQRGFFAPDIDSGCLELCYQELEKIKREAAQIPSAPPAPISYR